MHPRDDGGGRACFKRDKQGGAQYGLRPSVYLRRLRSRHFRGERASVRGGAGNVGQGPRKIYKPSDCGKRIALRIEYPDLKEFALFQVGIF